MDKTSKSPVEKAYDKALVFLKIRQHASAELKRKLSMRGFDKDIIEETIETLTGQGLLDDVKFAANYLDSLLRFKTYGYYGVMAKMQQRGVDKSSADKLLRENFTLEQETEIARRVVEKSREPDKMKLAGKLSRKGFRSEVIRKAIQDSSFPIA